MSDSSARATGPVEGPGRTPLTPLDLVRVVVLVAAIASLAFWGFSEFGMPLALLAGIGAPLLALTLWALFVSPRPVLRTHPFVRAVVELMIYAAVTMAWWAMGQPWIGLGFALVAAVAGLVAGRRALA